MTIKNPIEKELEAETEKFRFSNAIFRANTPENTFGKRASSNSNCDSQSNLEKKFLLIGYALNKQQGTEYNAFANVLRGFNGKRKFNHFLIYPRALSHIGILYVNSGLYSSEDLPVGLGYQNKLFENLQSVAHDLKPLETSFEPYSVRPGFIGSFADCNIDDFVRNQKIILSAYEKTFRNGNTKHMSGFKEKDLLIRDSIFLPCAKYAKRIRREFLESYDFFSEVEEIKQPSKGVLSKLLVAQVKLNAQGYHIIGDYSFEIDLLKK